MQNKSRTNSREKRSRGLNWWVKVCICIIYQRERCIIIGKSICTVQSSFIKIRGEERGERMIGEERRVEEREGEERRICGSLTCC